MIPSSDLENGDITPDMHLALGDLQSIPCYRLVFNDMVLEECWDWTDVPGVSFTEPNIITVVRYDRPVTTDCMCGLTWPRRRDPAKGHLASPQGGRIIFPDLLMRSAGSCVHGLKKRKR